MAQQKSTVQKYNKFNWLNLNRKNRSLKGKVQWQRFRKLDLVGKQEPYYGY